MARYLISRLLMVHCDEDSAAGVYDTDNNDSSDAVVTAVEA